MKNSDPGHNDPCPCGSGKKHKKCCVGREVFPEQRARMAEYFDEVRRAMEGKGFSTIEEANAFLSNYNQQRNTAPRDDFHGLSPDQMHSFIHFPFVSPQLVTLPAIISGTPAAPVLTLFGLLAGAIGEKGLKLTTTGNLPRNFCRDAAVTYWGEETYRERTRFGGINKDEDFPDLNTTRHIAEMAGLIRKYKGRFILTRDCRSLMAGNGISTIKKTSTLGYQEALINRIIIV